MEFRREVRRDEQSFPRYRIMQCATYRSNSRRGLRFLLEPPGDLSERLRFVKDPFFGGLRAKDVEVGEDDLEYC